MVEKSAQINAFVAPQLATVVAVGFGTIVLSALQLALILVLGAF